MLKHFILAFGFWLIAFGANAVEIKQVEANGVKAWVVQDNVLPIISIQIAFKKTGNAYDPKDKYGLAYATSAMLNEGAGDYSSNDYQKLLEENAIEFAADVDKDNFHISIKTLTENSQLAADLTNLALTKPKFEEVDFARIKTQLKSIIRKNEEVESKIAGKKLSQIIFKNHPYGNSQEGSIESVDGITTQDLHQYVKEGFAKDNIVVSIVGDVDQQTAASLLADITANLPEHAKLADIPEFDAYPKGQVAKIKMNNPQTYVIFAAKGIKRSDPDYYAAYVLNHILGGGSFSSRLMKEIRIKNGLAYSVGTQILNMDKTDLLLGVVSTKNASVDKSIRIINDEYRKLGAEGVSARELKDAKDYIIGSYGLNLDTNQALAGFLVNMQLYNLGMDYLDKRNDYFSAVTLEQVNTVAKRLISAENLVFVRVGM